jgi:hypothetical protein
MSLLNGNPIARAAQARDRRATLAAHRRANKGHAVLPLYRSPLAKLAWIFGIGR